MADVYIYADETGNLDYDVAGKAGASPYFGFGTVVYDGDHGDALFGGLQLRATIEGRISSSERALASGFHAKDDSMMTKAEVFVEVARQAPRFDATLLLKANAYDSVRAAGEMRLYKMAWFLHLKYVAQQVARRGDRLVVVVATLGTARRLTEAKAALRDVCEQTGLEFTLCVWDASTSWGLQVADYALWAAQRRALGRSGTWWKDYVRPLTGSTFFPWGRLPVTPSSWH